ncbi:MAG: ribonuclease P protein component [Gemmatimonadales bacterium]
MKDERFPRTARIGSGREIRKLLRTGRRCRLGPVDLFVRRAEKDRPRVGVIVPRYGHSAVERNRLRRRVKEIARREWLPVACRPEREHDLDVLIRVRREAYERSFDELRALGLENAERPCDV